MHACHNAGGNHEADAGNDSPAAVAALVAPVKDSAAAPALPPAADTNAGPVIPGGQQSSVPVKLQPSGSDERAFRVFYAGFRQAVKQQNDGLLRDMLYFPLQTAPQWTNDDLENMQIDRESGKVSRQEFNSYRQHIFNRDVRRLLPDAGEDALSEIDGGGSGDYYKTLRKCTDKGSKMYEVYMQYPEENGGAENYFAFVFGRVSGHYKVIGYYAKWPVKG
ncbi:MAG: hypothetical protein ACTHLD_16830 [Chitinophaga sp.]